MTQEFGALEQRLLGCAPRTRRLGGEGCAFSPSASQEPRPWTAAVGQADSPWGRPQVGGQEGEGDRLVKEAFGGTGSWNPQGDLEREVWAAPFFEETSQRVWGGVFVV